MSTAATARYQISNSNAAISPQLFALQPLSYRSAVVGPDPLSGRLDAMVITNGAFKLMGDWASGPLVREYSLSSDWDDRWRTGGAGRADRA